MSKATALAEASMLGKGGRLWLCSSTCLQCAALSETHKAAQLHVGG